MGNSVSNHRDQALESFAFFPLSNVSHNSDYGIYNSTGQLLKGNTLFEQYTELATQLDTKRSAFYLESKENELIFGCSLSVKAENGREERVVFIQVYKNLPLQNEIVSDIQLLKQFYERVKFEVENLDVKKYKLVGFWEEGDFRNIKEVPIEKEVFEYTAGKIRSNIKVSVKISELSSGLSFILKLISILRRRFTFIFDVSQYPSESNVSVSLIKPNPDFEIGENGTFLEFTKAGSWNSFKELGEEFFKDEASYSKGSQTISDSVSPVVRKILSSPSDYYISSNSFLDEFDDTYKVEIFKGLVQKTTDVNDPTIGKVFINISHKIESSECRKDFYKILLSRNIFIESLIADLVLTIHKKHNKDLFNLLFNKTSRENFPQNSLGEWAHNSRGGSKYNSFEKGVKKALNDLEYSDKVNFLKFIASESPSKPKAEGKILLESLIKDLVDYKGNNNFILELSDEDTENLDYILDRHYLDSKIRMKKRKRNKNIKTVFCAVALVMIILMSYLFVCYIHSTGNEGENNSSDTSIKNTSTFLEYLNAVYDNKSINSLEYAIISEDDQKAGMINN
ncbi:hypothetical protein EO98_19320 [Methanosarcina sp. 2.H.T.1A.6]|nr:hypothetical protein EO94_09920 [Methanosarcina sp. 2.H.T.1A.3]KKG19407.1 hypothetical protein EO98_19320 [Methanosarcina sp. 2.H.T.1A.6]KKG25552.1 hypothetical protein EO96_18525 [Methanosarcina sp. 2.H.T.1A.8]KKG26595.1 hypothetical protein EO97_01760 [Methanosarcina sp. 2.H.T.1A.15]